MTDPSEQTITEPTFAARVRIVLLACLPFWIVFWKPFFLLGRTATGFIEVDLPYYVANGRAAFERGNGFLGPNAFDCDPNAPAIYFHWVLWLLGFMVAKVGIDPGLVMTITGIVGAVAMFWMTLRLVEFVCPDPRYRRVLFLMVSWGGGIYCVTQLLLNVLSHASTGGSTGGLFGNLLRFDPAEGWWCQNWGRPAIIPTDAIYHALAAAGWLAFMSNRNWLGILFTALLAATHPFSGIQMLLIANAWLFLAALKQRDRRSILQLIVGMLPLATFVWYYLIYLERFPQHRALRSAWSLDWVIHWDEFLLGYLPVIVLVSCRVIADRGRLTRDVGFLAVAAVITFLLMKHEMFRAVMATKQPLHFTRGYLYFALALIALPWVQRCWISARSRLGGNLFRVMAISAAILWCADNLVFCGQAFFVRSFPGAHELPPAQREVLRYINDEKLSGIILCEDPDLSYLTAVYTRMRPVYGHRFLTPDYLTKMNSAREWFYQREIKPYPHAEVDFLLFPAGIHPPIEPSQWTTKFVNPQWILMARIREPTSNNAR